MHLRISRSPDGQTIWLNRNGVTSTFDPAGWAEFMALLHEFNAGAGEVQNYSAPARETNPVNSPVTRGKIASLSLADLGL